MSITTHPPIDPRGGRTMDRPLPSPGRTVMYRLTAADAERITARRAGNPNMGNPVAEGQDYPAVIARVWGTGPDSPCNLQVILDGRDAAWVTSAKCKPDNAECAPGQWYWPPRV